MKRNIQTTSGVYGIYAPNNLVIYVGCSKNLDNRYTSHLNQLLFKKHPNKDLQEFADLYGVGFLEFKVLNFCNESDLLYYEKLFINLLNPICNKNKFEKNNIHDIYNLVGFEYEKIIDYVKNNELPKTITTNKIKSEIYNKYNIDVSCKKIAKVLSNIGFVSKKDLNGRYYIKYN